MRVFLFLLLCLSGCTNVYYKCGGNGRCVWICAKFLQEDYPVGIYDTPREANEACEKESSR